MHKKYSGNKVPLHPDPSCAPDALGLLGLLMKDKIHTKVEFGNEKLEDVF